MSEYNYLTHTFNNVFSRQLMYTITHELSLFQKRKMNCHIY